MTKSRTKRAQKKKSLLARQCLTFVFCWQPVRQINATDACFNQNLKFYNDSRTPTLVFNNEHGHKIDLGQIQEPFDEYVKPLEQVSYFPKCLKLSSNYPEKLNSFAIFIEKLNPFSTYSEKLNLFAEYPEELNPFAKYSEDLQLFTEYPEELNTFAEYPEELNPFAEYPEELTHLMLRLPRMVKPFL